MSEVNDKENDRAHEKNKTSDSKANTEVSFQLPEGSRDDGKHIVCGLLSCSCGVGVPVGRSGGAGSPRVRKCSLMPLPSGAICLNERRP
jgi:hypothetical protein